MVSLRRTKDAPTKKGAAAKGAAPAKPKPPRGARAKQVRLAFTATRKADPRMPLLVGAALLVPVLVALVVGLVFGGLAYLLPLGIAVGLIAAVVVFGQRVQKTAYGQVEGQLGAAAAVLSNMRGDWRVTPAVGFTREQDLVHRVVGLPGIVLVAEGNSGRTRSLVVNEKKRLARFVGQTPVYDVSVGDGDGQVPLRGLEKHFLRLPRNIKPKEVNVLDRKLKAMAPALPVPKGPMPTRVPRGGRGR
ncbi:MAG: putative integral rane protein [Frankiales bacterium]|nr:putative integral rane protein [Frankiales bacterium]